MIRRRGYVDARLYATAMVGSAALLAAARRFSARRRPQLSNRASYGSTTTTDSALRQNYGLAIPCFASQKNTKGSEAKLSSARALYETT